MGPPASEPPQVCPGLPCWPLMPHTAPEAHAELSWCAEQAESAPGSPEARRTAASGDPEAARATASASAGAEAKPQSPVAQLFEGQLTSRIECQTCQHTAKALEPFQDLSLSIPYALERTHSAGCFPCSAFWLRLQRLHSGSNIAVLCSAARAKEAKGKSGPKDVAAAVENAKDDAKQRKAEAKLVHACHCLPVHALGCSGPYSAKPCTVPKHATLRRPARRLIRSGGSRGSVSATPSLRSQQTVGLQPACQGTPTAAAAPLSAHSQVLHAWSCAACACSAALS